MVGGDRTVAKRSNRDGRKTRAEINLKAIKVSSTILNIVIHINWKKIQPNITNTTIKLDLKF